MKKKYLVIILLISIITLVGCGSKDNKDKKTVELKLVK